MDSNVGRFVTSDAINGDQENPISLNKYTFAYNNPSNNDDPSGLEPNWGPRISELLKGNVKLPDEYDYILDLIVQSCDIYNIPVPVLASLTYMESGWDRNKLHLNENGSIDVGIGQLNNQPDDYSDIAAALDPSYNIFNSAKRLVNKVDYAKSRLAADTKGTRYSYVSADKRNDDWFLGVWGYKSLNKAGYHLAENWQRCFYKPWTYVLKQDASDIRCTRSGKDALKKVAAWENRFGKIE